MYKLKIVELPKPLNIKTQINFPEVVLGKMQEKTIIPKTTFQEILPDKNYDGLSKVNVEAVTNEIDENIKSENIKKNVSILGVQGSIEELKGTKIEITKNGTYIPEKPYNAFTEVKANMEPDLSEYFMESASSIQTLLKKIPMFILTGTSAVNLFYKYTNLVEIPQLDTSNITTMYNMCYQCKSLTSIPQLNTSKVTNMNSTFYGCSQLTEIPQLDTSNVTTMSDMFYNCSNLLTIPLLNASKVTEVQRCLQFVTNLKNLGGFQNLGQSYSTTVSANNYNYSLYLSSISELTHDSLMNVINNLYDIATKGCNVQQLILGSTNISKLSAEEIAIATNKGWSVS